MSQKKVSEDKNWQRVWLTDKYSHPPLPETCYVNPVDEFAEEVKEKLFRETSRRLNWQGENHDKSNDVQ